VAREFPKGWKRAVFIRNRKKKEKGGGEEPACPEGVAARRRKADERGGCLDAAGIARPEEILMGQVYGG